MLKAKDIMTKNVISTDQEADIKEAARLMYLNKLSGLPVLDSQENLVGILTEADLVKKEKAIDLPVMFGLLGTVVYMDDPTNGDEVEKQLADLLAKSVSDLMETDVVTVDVDDSLESVAEVSLSKHANPIPVVENGKMVGIISRADFVKLIARLQSPEDLSGAPVIKK